MDEFPEMYSAKSNRPGELSDYLKAIQTFSIDTIPFAVLPRRDLSQRFQSNILCEDCVRKQQIIYNESRHYVKDESVSC